MNRIILIGNGFDLAHGLPTSYCDFINNYWFLWRLKLLQTNSIEENDELCSFKIASPQDQKSLKDFQWKINNSMFQTQSRFTITLCLEEFDAFFQKLPRKYESKFFEEINKVIEIYNWVDIENIFYLWLKKIFKQDKCEYPNPTQLNTELNLIKKNLATYLLSIQKEQIKPELTKDCIRKIIYAPFNIDDISIGGHHAFIQFISERWNSVQDEWKVKALLSNYAFSSYDAFADIGFYLRDQNLDFAKHENAILKKYQQVPQYFLLPDQVLLLNFNYTKTANLYLPNNSEFRVNHIHGELDNEKNPIVFGYGDELDEDYKAILNLNDNKYLENIKSIRYLETDNYRKLLTFIDSAPYQVCIMGHSCGNSDRTLLNTLFEHKNCVSIKPYYYQKDDGTDNYIDIIQNISRDFNDMTLMRDRVVNKRYCQPLIAH